MKISKVIIVINKSKAHAEHTARELRRILTAAKVQQEWVPTLGPRKDLYRHLNDLRTKAADLVIACGGVGEKEKRGENPDSAGPGESMTTVDAFVPAADAAAQSSRGRIARRGRDWRRPRRAARR